MTDVGKSLFCRVTASNSAGPGTASDSNVVGPVTAFGGPLSLTSAPDIADTTPIEDAAITVTDGVWAGGTPITYAYEWHRVTGTPPVSDIELVCGPVYASVTNTASAATITFPVVPAIGDVVYVFGGTSSNSTLFSVATAGYVLVSEETGTGGLVSRIYRKVLTAADTAVVSAANIATHSLIMGALVLRGVNATPEDATPTNASGSSLDSSPAITTTTADTWVLSIMLGTTVGTLGNIPVAPSGYTNFAAQSAGVASATNVAPSAAASTKLVTAAGVEDPGNYGNNWNVAHGHTVAVRKA